MNQENSQIAIDEEIIISKIYNVRGNDVKPASKKEYW